MELFQTLLAQIPTASKADQTIVVRTADGNIHILENHGILNGDHSAEDRFLRRLGDVEVTHLVCLWQNGWPDLPSMHLRKGLLEINGNNRCAGILLQGENRYLVKQLSDTLPKKEN